MPELRFTVPGLPAPKGSMKPFRHGSTGKIIMTNANPNTLPWEHAVRVTALQARIAVGMNICEDGPVHLTLVFRLMKPKSAPKRRRTWPTGRRLDLDKLVRAILDALTGALYHDDGQVVTLAAEKDYGEPGVTIIARWLAEREQT